MISHRPHHNPAHTALCTAMAAALVAGCASSGQVAMKGSVPTPDSQMDRAMAKDIERAEADVAKRPQDAAARVALANAYLFAGRFESAATTFEDARYLGDRDAHTALSLALARIAMGDNAIAVEILDQSSDLLAKGDYGLALSLAGDTSRGVDVLADALRGGDNSAKMRQNLAYAYALDGRWREARLMAAQDVPADQIDARLGKWALQGKPEDFRLRVASLLGAPMLTDPGQPVQLTLSRSPVSSPALAANGDVEGELPPVENGESFWLAEAARPDPEPVASAHAPSEKQFAAADTRSGGVIDAAPANRDPDPRFVSRPVVQSVPARLAAAETPPQRRSRPVARSRNLIPAVKDAMAGAAGGSHLVQLGSFTSRRNAEHAWSIFLSRNPELQKFDKIVSQAMVGGKKYWRVSAGGFDQSAARQMCSTIKHRGGGCIMWSQGNPLPGAIARN